MKTILTTLEASNKYKVGTRHLRYLLTHELIQGRQAVISSRNKIWLIDETSLKEYLSRKRKRGPKPKK